MNFSGVHVLQYSYYLRRNYYDKNKSNLKLRRLIKYNYRVGPIISNYRDFDIYLKHQKGIV